MGVQIASNWSKVVGIEMNVANLQVVLTRHMVKVVPMKVGIQV
jgi:hypothetical protein